MKKIMFLLILICLSMNVKAYENDYFKINIPNNYKLEEKSKNTYKWIHNNDYIYIDVTDNKNKNDIKKYTQKDILSHKKYILESYKKSMKDTVDILNIQIINRNNIYYIEYYLKINSKKTINYDIYQKGRIYTSDNYVYNILINSDKQQIDNKILDTFEYKDSYPKKLDIKQYLLLFFILFLLILLLDYIISKKH